MNLLLYDQSPFASQPLLVVIKNGVSSVQVPLRMNTLIWNTVHSAIHVIHHQHDLSFLTAAVFACGSTDLEQPWAGSSNLRPFQLLEGQA